MGMIRFKLICCVFVLLCSTLFCQQAHALGCEGHQMVALIAMTQLNSLAAQKVHSILTAFPIDKNLKRWCGITGLPAIADSATWADDVRGGEVYKDTAAYHFIDIPLGVQRGSYDLKALCQQTKGCITEALDHYVNALKNEKDPAKLAEALRFVIHFLGDIHQPLHDADDSDRGGNCVPVDYFERKSHEGGISSGAPNGNYAPNLHDIWDSAIIRDMLKKQQMTVEGFADYLTRMYKQRMAAWQQDRNPEDWAWDAHFLAESVAYYELPVQVPIEDKGHIASCLDNNQVSKRRAALGEQIGEVYQMAAEAVIREQLAKAGFRLAIVLNDALGK